MAEQLALDLARPGTPAALRDAGLLPPDGGRTLRDDLEAVDRG